MSIQFEVQREVRVPKERLYAALLDLEAAEHWMQGLVRMERQDTGPMQEGSSWIETRKMYGREASEHFEVVELKAPEKIRLRVDGTKGASDKGEYRFTYTVEESGDASTVTLNGEIRGLTGLTKLFVRMMVSTFGKACAKDLDSLKEHLESKQD
ncbi:polyketide cyclase / dehydrase and lipid transport [Bhargavaea cecembensis]|uniref:Polyketide cyclase / dehydrase and lipid transport n=1 Tax=Bhargavaea cecembensis TaxID=394098 RepID=A0A161SIZ8_9BACL|nr:SRPBCC family protein [Bhargavaea cecembensis]KZE37173.1 polyketide cyclase / dehydrase and lipid transport [Bhargavaea cecembensis]